VRNEIKKHRLLRISTTVIILTHIEIKADVVSNFLEEHHKLLEYCPFLIIPCGRIATLSRIFNRTFINRMIPAVNDSNRYLEQRMKLWSRYSSCEIFKNHPKITIEINNKFCVSYFLKISYSVRLETIRDCDKIIFLVQNCVRKCNQN
jgi:hypothetical protein